MKKFILFFLFVFSISLSQDSKISKNDLINVKWKMKRYITDGLSMPIEPAEEINDSKKSRSVAILGDDYIGMKPTMLVEEGDEVKLGQALFEDKKNPGVIFTSPAGGKVESINRGDRRALQSVVIEIAKDEDSVDFKSFSISELNEANTGELRKQLIASGMWTSFRTRPYSKIPNIDSSPKNLFVVVK